MLKYLIAAIALAGCATAAAAQQKTVGAGPAPAPAPAQTASTEVANNTAFGNWLLTCQAVTVNTTACRLVQSLTRSDDQSLVLRLIVIRNAADQHLLLAQTPIGVYLPAGAVYRFEGSPEDVPQRQMVWQKCLGEICEAAFPLTADELATFGQYQALLFGYRMSVNEEPIVVRIDISQFGAAIAALATANK